MLIACQVSCVAKSEASFGVCVINKKCICVLTEIDGMLSLQSKQGQESSYATCVLPKHNIKIFAPSGPASIRINTLFEVRLEIYGRTEFSCMAS